MKRVLFRRIFISYLVIAPVLLIVLELYLSSVIKNNYILTLRENLLTQARLIADGIPLSLEGNLDDLCRKYKEKTGARITIIDSLGRVAGDSDESSEKMENHMGRPEIKEASLNSAGSSIRFSSTLQKDFFYLAAALDSNAEKGFLRLSVPLHDLDKAISDVRKQIALASITALFIAILMGLFQTKKITKSIEEIAKFSREIRSGNFKARLFLREKGEIGELAGNINDMAHELKTMLERSREEKHRMEEILRNMSDGLMLIENNGNILLCNAAAKKFFGIESDAEGRPLIETLRNAELAVIIKKALAAEETVSQEIEVMYPREFSLLATAVPFYYPPERKNASSIVLSLHDITRLKQLEAVRKDFIANVSHEIKTPITAIKGFTDTLLEGAIDDKENASRFLQTIKNHSERLNSLVSDLLTLSSIELGDVRIEKQNVDINNLTDTVLITLMDKAKSKGLFLKKSFPPEISEIYADKNRLMQILLNLVDNGIKFTESGSVTIGIEKANEHVILFVEDTGAGIPKRHLSRLGERFYRVDRSRSRELGGTGLGLAIVKHLVKAHGWEMNIESAEGKGTKVRISLS